MWTSKTTCHVYVCITLSTYDISVLKAIMRYYHKRQSQKVASLPNSFGIGSVLNWFIKVAWPTESADTNQQTPVYRFFSIKTVVTSYRLLGMSNIPQGLSMAYLRSPIMIGDNKREYLSHEPWIHGTFLMWAPHVWCCVTDFSSLTTLLEYLVTNKIKVHLHLMASMNHIQFRQNFSRASWWCLLYLWSVCRRPFMPTDSFYCAGRVRGCRQSPECAGRLRIAQTPWSYSNIMLNCYKIIQTLQCWTDDKFPLSSKNNQRYNSLLVNCGLIDLTHEYLVVLPSHFCTVGLCISHNTLDYE